MPPGQGPLDTPLAWAQPVHGRVQIVLVHRIQPQGVGQRIARGGLGQAPGGGEPGARIEHPGDDHGHHAVALGRALRGDEPLQTQLSERAEHRGDRPVGARAHDVEGVVEPRHRGAALEQDTQALDQGGGPFGEIGQGALFDFPRRGGRTRAAARRAGSCGWGRTRCTWATYCSPIFPYSQILLHIITTNTWLLNPEQKATQIRPNQPLGRRIKGESGVRGNFRLVTA